MRFTLPAPDIEDDGFASGSDIFGRSNLSASLISLVEAVEDPLVIALDAQWGSGKTIFLKTWQRELAKAGIPVIYLDAFENDYVEDAFSVLVREIVRVGAEAKPLAKQQADDFRKHAVELGGMLLRGGLKLGAKAAVRVATAGLLKDVDIKEVVDEAGAEIVDAAEAQVSALISDAENKSDVVEEFRKRLAALPGALQGSSETTKPLIYIIDELDRCKPHFALAILERIKHFMSVQNVHFVLGVHKSQLESSVRFAYGAEIDAALYLQKFIGLTINFDERSDPRREGDIEKYIDHLLKKYSFRPQDGRVVENISHFVKRVSVANQYSLRTIERLFLLISLSVAFSNERSLRLAPIIAGLCILKLNHPLLYLKAARATLTYDDVVKPLAFDKVDLEAHSAEWEVSWWRYCLADELDEELEKKGRSLGEYSIARTDIVSFTVRSIVSRISAG